MLQEENAGPRSRVTSQSSNSSWVDIMDEEVLYVCSGRAVRKCLVVRLLKLSDFLVFDACGRYGRHYSQRLGHYVQPVTVTARMDRSDTA